MVSAVWNDATIAASDKTVIGEGNHYFPPETVDHSRLEESEHSSVCPIKGRARYYHVLVGGERNPNAAWTYPNPTTKAEAIRDHVAFWKGVEVA